MSYLDGIYQQLETIFNQAKDAVNQVLEKELKNSFRNGLAAAKAKKAAPRQDRPAGQQ